MAEALGIVDVGGTSCGLRSFAVVKRRLGGKALLEWIVRRVSDAQQLDQIIVLVGDAAQHHECLRLTPSNTPVFLSTDRDPLARYAAALRQFNARSVVRIDIANPLIDPFLIDRLVRTANCHPYTDYVGYCRNDGRSVVHSHLGVCAEWCRGDALLKAEREAVASADREDPTRYVVSHPELFNLRVTPLPAPLDRDDLRLSLEVDEDWDHIQLIFDALGPDRLDWERIARLLDSNPAIRERMAELNQHEPVVH